MVTFDSFLQAIMKDDSDMVMASLKLHPKFLYSVDGYRRTPFHIAAMYNSETVVPKLLTWDKNAATILSVADSIGWTPLHYAAWMGHRSMANSILELKRELVNLAGDYGMTPLHLAAQFGHVPTVELLVQFGAAISNPNCWGRTPLDLSILYSKDAVTELLVRSLSKHSLDACNAHTRSWLRKTYGAEFTTELMTPELSRSFDL